MRFKILFNFLFLLLFVPLSMSAQDPDANKPKLGKQIARIAKPSEAFTAGGLDSVRPSFHNTNVSNVLNVGNAMNLRNKYVRGRYGDTTYFIDANGSSSVFAVRKPTLKDFNCVCNGMANDSAAMQSFLNYVATQKDKTAYVGGIDSIVLGSVFVPSNVNIEGDGKVVFLHEKTTRLYSMFRVYQSKNIQISNIKIKGSRDYHSTGVSFSGELYIQESENVNIKNIEIFETIGQGIRILDSKNITLQYSTIRDIHLPFTPPAGDPALYIDGSSENIILQGVKIKNVNVRGLIGSLTSDPNRNSFGVQTDGANVKNLIISNCILDSITGIGFKLQGGDGIALMGSICTNIGSWVSCPTGTGDIMLNVEIKDNIVKNVYAAILIGNGEMIDGFRVSNNTIEKCTQVFRQSNSTATKRNFTFEGNVIKKVSNNFEQLVIVKGVNTTIKNNEIEFLTGISNSIFFIETGSDSTVIINNRVKICFESARYMQNFGTNTVFQNNVAEITNAVYGEIFVETSSINATSKISNNTIISPSNGERKMKGLDALDASPAYLLPNVPRRTGEFIINRASNTDTLGWVIVNDGLPSLSNIRTIFNRTTLTTTHTVPSLTSLSAGNNYIVSPPLNGTSLGDVVSISLSGNSLPDDCIIAQCSVPSANLVSFTVKNVGTVTRQIGGLVFNIIVNKKTQ